MIFVSTIFAGWLAVANT